MKLIEEDVESGGKEHNIGGIENDFAYNNSVHNADINIRLGFLRKVYGLLSIQLLMTVMIATIFMAFQPLKIFVQENSWTLILSFIMTMGTLVALFIKRREHPLNLMLLTFFTLAEAYTVGILVSMFDVITVVQALFLTLTVMVGLTVYTFQSKQELSLLLSGLFVGLWILLLGGLMQIFIQSTALGLLLCIAGAILMCMFIIYDTHMIMYILSPEEYVLATINIYLDIINLFIYILRILAISKE